MASSHSASLVHGNSSSGRQASARNTQTAYLFRFVSLNDRFDSQIFTFIIPSHLYHGYCHELYSKEFVYNNQHWYLKMTRSERHIGVFLVIKNALAGMAVRLDYTFTVINREHFTRNESISEREIDFTAEQPARGRNQFIEIADLANRNFLFDDNAFLLELQLKSATTHFHDDLVLPRDIGRELPGGRLESAYVSFGSCDWNLSIEPSEAGGTAIFLNRHSRFEHWCRITYRALFTVGDQRQQRTIDSGVIEQLLDVDGYGRSHLLEENLFRLAGPKGRLQMELKMISMSPMAIVELIPTNRSKNLARFYDCDKREWLLESDILGKLVKLRLFFADIHNLPRLFTRVVSFKVYIVPYDRNRPLVKALSSPYCCFYSQKEIDDGFEVCLNLPVEEVCDPGAGYVHPQQGILTVQVEWVHSHLLCYDQYHYYDNISRLQKHQMSREILALQAENYSLEKQVHNYQVTLSVNKIDLPAPVSGGAVPPVAPANNAVPKRGQNYGATAAAATTATDSTYGARSDYLGAAPSSPSTTQQDRRHRALPNAPQQQQYQQQSSQQYQQQSSYQQQQYPQQHQQQQYPQQQGQHRSRHYTDANGPSSSYPGGRAPPPSAPHMGAGGYGSSGRASPSMARMSNSPASQRSHAKQRNGNGRVPYEEVTSRSGGRRMEERW